MTTNFEALPYVALTLHDFFIFVYWLAWANGFAAMTKDKLWCLPINFYFLGGVLNFML